MTREVSTVQLTVWKKTARADSVAMAALINKWKLILGRQAADWFHSQARVAECPSQVCFGSDRSYREAGAPRLAAVADATFLPSPPPPLSLVSPYSPLPHSSTPRNPKIPFPQWRAHSLTGTPPSFTVIARWLLHSPRPLANPFVQAPSWLLPYYIACYMEP